MNARFFKYGEKTGRYAPQQSRYSDTPGDMSATDRPHNPSETKLQHLNSPNHCIFRRAAYCLFWHMRCFRSFVQFETLNEPVCTERYRKLKCKERPMTTTPTTVSEADAIAKTVQIYVDGGRSGRGDDMKAAFHPDATIFGYLGNDLFAGPIQKVFDRIDQNGPATELESRIASLDICETIATVRLELDNWTGHRYTDMLTLLKVEGEWKIIRKVFYMHS